MACSALLLGFRGRFRSDGAQLVADDGHDVDAGLLAMSDRFQEILGAF